MAGGEYDEGGDPENGNPTKRQKTSQLTDTPVPRFLVVKRTDQNDFGKINPFLISKTVYSIIGETKNIKKINGGLLIETSSAKQTNRLLECTKFGEYTVRVEPHSSLNTTKGVITCRDLQNCSVEELLAELRSQDVSEVRRITRRQNGIIENTASLIITFNRTELPSKIRAAMYSLPVRPYIPSPMRCFNCQLFGHLSKRCTKPKLCICGLPPHESHPCIQPIKCINCEGNHNSTSKECPKFKEEYAITEYKTLNKCSYPEARSHIQRNSPKFPISCAKIVRESITPPPSANEIAALLLPQIKNLVQEIISANMSALLKTTIPSIITPPPKTPTITQHEPYDTNSSVTPTPITSIVSAIFHPPPPIRQQNTQKPRETSYLMDQNTRHTDSGSESSGMSLDNASVDAARKRPIRSTTSRSKKKTTSK